MIQLGAGILIVNGRAEITAELTHEALQQLSLRYRLACDACEAYAGAGFTVIYQDVILGEYLNEVHTRLSRWSPGVLVLNPALDVVARRDAERAQDGLCRRLDPCVAGCWAGADAAYRLVARYLGHDGGGNRRLRIAPRRGN